MRILIRSDASVQIGTGHIMRCLTLAEKLRERGHDVDFLCRAHAGNLIGRIASRGFTAHTLPPGSGPEDTSDPTRPPHARWLEASWREDAEAVAGIIAARFPGSRVDGIIVDHYGIDAAWESRSRPLTGWMAVIDDLADRPHDCDLLLDQNLYEGAEGRYAGLVPPECRMLLGPGYALLREEFSQARSLLRKSSGSIDRLLIYFGGFDPGDNTSKTLEALALAGWEGKAADIVVGEGHPRRKEIEAHCARHPGRVVHVNVERMSDLMVSADLAIGAGGTTSWERCCLGLPCLAICVAENQAELLRVLDSTGALIHLGSTGEVSAARLAEAMRDIEAHPDKLLALSQTALSLVDGSGADRVASALAEQAPAAVSQRGPGPHPWLRRARPGDAALYFEWTNEEETRRNSFHSAPVEWPGHFAWFRSKLRDEQAYLYILEGPQGPAGQLRYQCDGPLATLGFSIDSSHRGRGLGRLLLETGARKLFADRAETLEIHGFVKKTNVPSAKAFRNAGFTLLEEKFHEGAECLLFVLKRPSGGSPAA